MSVFNGPLRNFISCSLPIVVFSFLITACGPSNPDHTKAPEQEDGSTRASSEKQNASEESSTKSEETSTGSPTVGSSKPTLVYYRMPG